MKVLQIIADGSPGGGTTHVLQILRSLSSSWQLGLCTQRSSYLAGTARRIGIECFEIEPFGATRLLRVPREIRRIVQGFRPDLIHAHGSRAGFLTALANAQVPLVYTVHGLHILRRPAMTRWMGICAERLTNRRSVVTIFVSSSDRSEALAHHLQSLSHPSHVIHNGIPTSAVDAVLSPRACHVGFVGRLEPPKDPLLFLRVMEQLPGYHATMVGGGSLEGEVRKAVARHAPGSVRLLGALAPDAALKIMREFDVLLVPSRWEALGLVALEAMAMGVPVVAARVGGLAEVVEDGVSGLLANSRSPDDLARCVRRVAEDLCLRQRFVEAGKCRVRELFSEEKMIREIGEVYSRATQSQATLE